MKRVCIVFGLFIKESKGATSIEYALIASLVSISIIGALFFYQEQMDGMYQYISDSIAVVFQ